MVPAPGRRLDAAAPAWLWALPIAYGALVFLPMLRNFFWADDYGWVATAIETTRHPLELLAPAKTDWRPIAKLTFLVDLRLWGLHPAGYYAFNLLVHLANVAMLMGLAWRITGGDALVALVAGALFASGFGHFGESVIWICARTGLIADGFALISLLAHWSWLEHGRVRDRPLTFAAFVLALLTKESAITLLPLLALLEWVHGVPAGTPKRAWIVRYAPFAVVLVLYLALELFALRGGRPIEQGRYALGWHALVNFGEYFARMVVPLTASSIMLKVPEGVGKILGWLTAELAIGMVLLWAALFARTRSRPLRFAILWMAVTVFPYVFFTTRTSTRYLYGPAQGLALAVGLLFAAWRDRMARGPVSAGLPRAGRWVLAGLLVASATVVNVVIHQRHEEQKAAGTAAYEELVRLARDAGLEER